MHWEWSKKLLYFMVLAFGSWITLVSCNALGIALHIEVEDGQWTMNRKMLVTIVVILILDSYQSFKIFTSMVRCTGIHRICNKQHNLPKYWLSTLFASVWIGSPSALWSCTFKPIWGHSATWNCKLIDKYNVECRCMIIQNKCTWNCKNNPKLHLKCIKNIYIIMQDANHFNLKLKIQCSFQPKPLQSKRPGN